MYNKLYYRKDKQYYKKEGYPHGLHDQSYSG